MRFSSQSQRALHFALHIPPQQNLLVSSQDANSAISMWGTSRVLGSSHRLLHIQLMVSVSVIDRFILYYIITSALELGL